MKPFTLALIPLLAAAILLPGEFSVTQGDFSRARGVVSAMGTAPAQGVDKEGNLSTAERPAASQTGFVNATGETASTTARDTGKTAGNDTAHDDGLTDAVMDANEASDANRTIPEPLAVLAQADSGTPPDSDSRAERAFPWRKAPEGPQADPTRADDTDSQEMHEEPVVPPQPETPRPTNPAPGAGGKTIRLFQTAAFRGNFDALPKWKRVLSKADAQVRALNTCTTGKGCPAGAASWQRILQQARGMGTMEQLKAVNSFFNKWPYRLDQDAYGTSDWWATPQEFLKLSGDCEDYAITKYFALRELGYSPDDLRIVVLKDKIRGIAHAILAVFVQGDAYVLDNLSNVVFPHTRYRHYVPYYSLNEQHRWSHIPVERKP